MDGSFICPCHFGLIAAATPLLRLLGVHAESGSEITGTALAFHTVINPALLILLTLALTAYIVWEYRRTPDLAPLRKYTLATLRISFLLLLLLLLLRPALTVTLEGRIRRTLVLLLDGTRSMNIRDPRVSELDVKRSNWNKDITRLDLARSLLKDDRLKLFPRIKKNFDLAPYRLAATATELAATNWLDDFTATNAVTAIGDSLREIISRKSGQPIAGIFLVTDGANNSGTPPRDVAGLAKQEGLPLYIYGVGITSPPDIIVNSIFAQELTFIDDEVPVTVRVRSQNLRGKTAKLTLTLGDKQVDQQEITFDADGEQVIALKFTPNTAGEFDLTAAIAPLPEETVKDNNSVSQRIRVIDAKIKVLLIEQYPRWEFRYLQANLMRDRRVQLKCLLYEGDPGIATGENSPYLDKFPAKKEDLFKYDLIVLGDVDPKLFTPEQLDALGEFVAKFGGGFMMIAGKRYSPAAYTKTVIEKLLPVEFDPYTINAVGENVGETPIRLELTAEGRANSMLRLAEKSEDSLARWTSLPPIYWDARVSRPKPGAEVLLVDADPAKATRFGKMPVIAAHQYGAGRVLFIGTDNTWRWRKNVGETFFTTLWGQITQRMALAHLLGGAKRTQLSTDRRAYLAGERVTVFARLYNASFEPVTDPTVRGTCTTRDANGRGPSIDVQLRPSPEQRGMYRGELVAPLPGRYKFQVESDKEARVDFDVVEPQFELGDTAMNEPLLKEMATLSGGEFFHEEDLNRLPDAINRRGDKVRSSIEVDLWSSPFYFLLMLVVATAEWILRKVCQLK